MNDVGNSVDTEPRERAFEVSGLRFAAQEWGREGERPVLALHGWLDNSASFAALAPQLSGIHLVALDMAGHGRSDHRPGSQPYNIWQDVGEVFGVADQLGWESFTLIGHSRGAIVSMLAAGTFPERICDLVLIDGLWPEPVVAEDAPQQLARSIRDATALQHKPPPVYQSRESIINARYRGRSRLSREAAMLLTDRGMRQEGDGFTWSTDPHLMGASAFKLTQDHIQAFINRIAAKTLLILAKEGLPRLFDQYQEILAMFPHIHVEKLSGSHHLHMEAQSPQVAALIRRHCGLSE